MAPAGCSALAWLQTHPGERRQGGCWGDLPGTPVAAPAAAPGAHLAGRAGACGLSADMTQDRAVPEPGVDQPPWGWLLPRDAVVVIVLSHLLILPPGRLLRAQRPAVRMGWLGTPCPAWTPPHTCRDRGSQSDPQPGDMPGTGGVGPRQDSHPSTCPGVPPPWGGCADTA